MRRVMFLGSLFVLALSAQASATVTDESATRPYPFGAISFHSPATTFPIAADDFDGDGSPDLLLSGPDGLLFRAGNGDGTFGKGVVANLDPRTRVDQVLAIDDLDDDGDLDILAANGSSTLVLQGTGDGRFNESSGYGQAYFPGDFDGDGRLDLARLNLINTSPVMIAVRTGKANGYFSSEVAYPVTGPDSIDCQSGCTQMSSPVSGDFNGDGSTDIAVARYDAFEGAPEVLLRNGGEFLRTTNPNGPYSPSTLAASDLDQDGIDDLLSIEPQRVQSCFCARISLSNGDGSFTESGDVAASPGSLVITDFDQDGNIDLAGGTYYRKGIRPVFGLGGGDFALSAPEEEEGFESSPRSVSHAVSADFNGDGHSDLAVTRSNDWEIQLFGATSQPRTPLLQLLHPPTHGRANRLLSTRLSARCSGADCVARPKLKLSRRSTRRLGLTDRVFMSKALVSLSEGESSTTLFAPPRSLGKAIRAHRTARIRFQITAVARTLH